MKDWFADRPHHYIHAGARRRTDPTQTLVLRRAYDREIRKRFKALLVEIRKRLDRLGLVQNASYSFERDGRKIESFLTWLKSAQSRGILGVEYGTPLASAAQQQWQNLYIRSAYRSGMANAAGSLREGGATVEQTWVDASFSRPIHADRVGMIYTRSFMSLSGITEQMDAALSRTLAQGVVDGLGVRELTRLIVRDVGMAQARAQMLARTEVIATHADATLNGLQEAGAREVEPEVEFSSSRDSAVCPRCAALEGKRFSVDEARGIIPVHPSCRCNWRVVPVGLEGIVLR